MTKVDFRDKLFAELHEQFLRPLGYRRRARRSEAVAPEGIALSVSLESSRWNTSERIDFGIDLQARHSAYVGGLLMNIGLRRYVDPPRQRWSVDEENSEAVVCKEVEQAFSSAAVPLLKRMSTFEGLAALCAEFGPIRFFESHCWCLLRAGKTEQAIKVLEDAVLNAPHDGLRGHAIRLLEQHRG